MKPHLSNQLIAAFFVFGLSGSATAQDKKEERPDPAQFAAAMEKAKKFTQPSEHHKLIEKFLGKWDMEMHLFMAGKAMPPEKGTLECDWLMEGRWLNMTVKGTMMGRPHESVTIFGYDNFKMSYVTTSVSSIDTAMVRMEGDLDPGGKTLLLYGTLDEYLTGEHDKMVKAVWRFVSDTEIIMELHDLPIGEKNTKVLEYKFTKKK